MSADFTGARGVKSAQVESFLSFCVDSLPVTEEIGLTPGENSTESFENLMKTGRKYFSRIL